MMKKWMSMVAVLMLAVVLAACGGAAPAATGDGGTPEATAKTFLEALFTGNIEGLRANACATALTSLTDEAASAMTSMFADATADFSGVTYTVSDATDTSATVNIAGAAKLTISGTSQDMPMEGSPFASLAMVKENGVWKACPTI